MSDTEAMANLKQRMGRALEDDFLRLATRRHAGRRHDLLQTFCTIFCHGYLSRLKRACEFSIV